MLRRGRELGLDRGRWPDLFREEHFAEWAEFRNADPVRLGELVAGKLIVDGRNCLDPAAWIAAGWRYHGMGFRVDGTRGRPDSG